ncbi:MAG: amino acid adenylation domain-containing protein, partial [Pseudomonadota bacterium]
MTHAAVKDAIVVAKASATGDKRLVAYVVAESENNPEFIAQLGHHLRETLPDYMVPSAFVLLDQFPLTLNGKVDRKSLPEPDISSQQNAYVAPRTETEKVLCDIWQEVLGVERVGITDNFFQLGGHSLTVLVLITAMNSKFDANIRVRDLFIAPTIKELISEADFAQPAVVYQQLENGLLQIKALQKSILENVQHQQYLPKDYDDFYPLSAIQQSMVFFAQAQPEVPMYHDQFPYVFALPNFNFSNFQKAIDCLCQIHPILRTSFDVMNFEVPLQMVHTNSMVDVKWSDLSHLPVGLQQLHIEDYCRQDLQKKFSFQHDELLWRIHVFALDDKKICCILSFQHAILDGWSVNAMTAELMQYYSALNSNLMLPIKQLRYGYKDYVAINLARSTSDTASHFWRDYLKDYSRMKLPFNYGGRPISSALEMQILRSDISQEFLQSLQQYSQITGFSIKEICLAAHVHTLSLLTGDTEVLTGVVTHDRPALAGTEKILGCFLNTIPLRLAAGTSGNKTDLLKNVHNYLHQTKEHELFLGEIARLVGEYHSDGNPLFDTVFNFTDFPASSSIKTDVEALTVEALNNESYSSSQATATIAIKSAEMTNTLLDIEVHKRAERGMMVQVKYSPKYFHVAEMEMVLSLYINVLKSFVSAQTELPSMQLISAINAVGSNHGFNQTVCAYRHKATLHQLFEEQVLRAPNAVALRQDGMTLSYAQLNQRANKIARLLMSNGLRSGDHVGLILERSFDLIACIFGILKVGAAYVPMEPNYPSARKQAIAQSAELKAILVDHSADEANDLYIRLNETELALLASDNLNIHKDSFELAYIIYTSGSTGKPKGVRIAHHAAVNLVSWVNREFAISSSDIMLFITSVSFDLSVYDIFGLLSAGGSIVIAEQTQVHDPKRLLELIKTEHITFWDSVPTTLNHLMNEVGKHPSEQSLSSLKLVFLSGDWIPVHLPGSVKKYFPNAQVISLGGATEGTVWSNYYPVSNSVEHRSSIPYGKPIDNNRFYILDAQQNPVINGVVGELYIAGVGVADGYQNDPERTCQAFFSDPFVAQDINGQAARMYKTGDLGRMLPCGNMELHGRVDHQIKLRGFRIELGEIESVINQYEWIKEAVVSLITTEANTERESSNQYLVAYIVAIAGTELSTDLLTQYLASYLPEYMVPRIFVPLDYLPLTQNGKVDRKALPVPDISAYATHQYVAPATDVEKILCDIWQEILGMERVGLTDNFFQLGGHSLSATRLVARINQSFGVALPLTTLFSSQTLAHLAQALLALDANLTRPVLMSVSRDEVLLASYAQQRLWLLGQIDGGSTHYNIPGALRLNGVLNIDAVNQAFTSIFERHESLRTCFVVDENGQPLQVIQSSVSFTLPVINLVEVEEGVRQSQLIQVIADEANRVFDLSRDLMLRAQLIRIAADEHILLV